MDSKYRGYHKARHGYWTKYMGTSNGPAYCKLTERNNNMYNKPGFFRIMLDLILGFMTGGIWWLVLAIRYFRTHS